jgi:hypothetical protein
MDNGEEENLLPVLAIKAQFNSRPARSLVTVPTEVLRLPYITLKKKLSEEAF